MCKFIGVKNPLTPEIIEELRELYKQYLIEDCRYTQDKADDSVEDYDDDDEYYDGNEECHY